MSRSSIFVEDKGNVTMKTDQSRVQSLLRDTITLLCRNSLNFTRELKVQGLLGITMDDDSIFIVHIDESFVAEFDEMSVNENEVNDVDYGKVELVESVTRGRPEARKRMIRGPGRIRNTHVKGELVHSGENYGNDFVTDAAGFVGGSSEQTVFENHLRISAIKSDFSCGEEDAKPFSMASPDDAKDLIVQLNARTVCHRPTRSSSGHVQDRLWGPRPSHESMLNSTVVKNEPYTAADSSQFMTGGPDLAIVIPEEDFAEMDKLFEGASNESSYAVNQDQGYLHSSVLSDSDTGFRTARPMKAPPAYDQNPRPSNASSFQCLPKSSRTLGRSSFNSSNVWKNNKKPQRPHRFQPNSLILTKSFHICGYPDCGKQFFHRRHLLRHQTQKHGRVPTRIANSPRRGWTDLQSVQGNSDDCQVQGFIDYCTNSTAE